MSAEPYLLGLRSRLTLQQHLVANVPGTKLDKEKRTVEVTLVFRQGRSSGGHPMMVADIEGWDFQVQVSQLSDNQVKEGERWRCRMGCGAWVWPVERMA